jgi:hypothetical protein
MSSGETKNDPTIRPDEYWVEISKKFDYPDFKTVLASIIYREVTFYRALITKLSNSKLTYFIKLENMTSDHYLLSLIGDEAVMVIDHTNAQSMLDNLILSNFLPKNLPNGKTMPKIKTFDQLIALMSNFNPFWLLELASQDSLHGRINPNFNYEVNLSQVEEIKRKLAALKNKQ